MIKSRLSYEERTRVGAKEDGATLFSVVPSAKNRGNDQPEIQEVPAEHQEIRMVRVPKKWHR